MGDKPRILVVDDEVGVRESLRVILRPQYDLVTVESGEAALQALSTFHPDVVLLDIKMPAPDGLEVLQRMKAHDRTIEVVMVTAYASFETLRKSLTDGAFEYLIKPFSRRQVEETVRQALARRTSERGAAGQTEASGRVSIGLVGGGTGGSALLDLLLEWVPGKVAVVVDPRPDAPALSKARTLGIPTAEHHREAFAYPVDLVLEATGQPAVLDDLVRTKPPGVEVIGSGSLRFFWDLLQSKVTATRQLRAQLDMAVALESTLDLNQQVVILTRKLAQACGVDRCSLFLRDEATGLVIPVMAQFATGESNERMWNAFQDLGRLKLVEIPFLYEAMERQGPIAIDDPASNPLVPPGWIDLFEFKSLLVVPIFRKNQVVGACVLDYCREARRFTPDQTVLASALASQIALALENARLYQDVVEKADRLASLLEATKRTVAIKDSHQLLPWIAQEAATCLKAEGAGIRILEGEELVYAGHYGYSWEGMRDRIGLGESGTGWVVRHNQPLAIPDIERDPRILAQHRTAYCREGFHSMLAVPMRVAERAIGALFVFTKSLRQFSATEVEILSGFADQAALAVENLLLYEETEQRRREAEVLAELGRNVTASLNLDTVLQRVAEGAKDLCRSDLAQIALRDPGSEALAVRHLVGTRYQGYNDIRIEAGKGLGGRVLLTERPIRTNDYAEDPQLTKDYLHVIREEGIVAEMVVPIRIDDRIQGLLYVANRSPRPFTDGDEAILLRLADYAAIAIQNARLYAETSGSAAERQALLELAGLIGSTLNLDRVLDVIVERAQALLKVRAAGLFKVDPRSDLLVYERGIGLSREFIDSLQVLVGEGTSGRAVQDCAPVWSSDLLNDPTITMSEKTRDLVTREGYRAVLSVPMVIKGTPSGVLAVYWWEPHSPALSEIRLLSALAGQAAVALENARLFEEAQRRRMTAERLAEVGHLLSRSLDPSEVGQRIVDSIRGLLGALSAFLVRVESADGDWTVVAASGQVGPGFQRGMAYPREVGATGLALRERRAVVTLDVLNDPHIIFTPDVRTRVEEAGHRAVLALPLLIQDRPVGVLAVGDRAGRAFSDEEIHLAQAFADQAATALENSRLYRETQLLLASEQTSRAAAEASEERFRELVQDLEAIVWEAEAEPFRFCFVSQRAEAILGYPIQQWLREADFWRTHLHPDDREQVRALVDAAIRAGRDYNVEYRMVRADGGTVWLRDCVRIVPAADGRLARLRGVTVDITRGREAEEALRQLSRQHELILTSVGEGIYGLDSEGITTFVNPAAAAMLGWTAEELIGQSQHARSHHSKPDGTPYRPEECPVYAAFRDGRVHHVENEVFWRKDGTSFPVEYTSTPIREEHGQLIGAVVTFRDASERQELEAQLRQAQKMEAVGRLAGGVAHDFNNLLTVILARSQFLLNRLRPDDPSRRDTELIYTTAQRTAALIKQLLAFSRKQVLQPRVLDLNALIGQISTMLRRLIGEDIDLVIQLGAQLDRVKADPGQLEQVLVNLVVNARDAMPAGGRLIITTHNVELDKAFVRQRPGARTGPHVMLAVSDTGIGMDEKTQARVFEPFFTTKAVGQGTGLGLSTVYGIVKQHEGYIAVDSQPGQGATLTIYLPRAEEPVEAAETGAAPPAAPPRGSETVLLAEDELEVRRLAGDILRMSGYTVLEASHPDEAFGMAERHAGAIHLLVTDVVMPDMSGPVLAARLLQVRRDLRVLYISGYPDDALDHRDVFGSGAALLPKPFTAEALAWKVREVLDAPQRVPA